ncbi:hypothetical protein LTR17_020377 [Elasticomyces elasticus]|nr:hypothetical protein LTR17_020377 [Elasticomyces elasticus]
MLSTITTSLLALVALSTLPIVAAHSWIEEFQIIDSNGSYIGDRGFPRGYMARTDPGYNGFVMNYLLPETGVRITSNDSLCHPAQRTSNYTNPAYPKLQVTPGSYVAMKYLENGHVTLPWNQLGKPPAGGTVFVYGTTQPSDEEKIADVLPWTSDGKGGNGKGFLMTAQNFDDGRCYQINCGNISTDRQTLFPNHVADQPTSVIEQWCETDLKIPETIAAGTLSVYWVWQWPTESNKDCTYPEDFEIVAGSDDANAKILAAPATHTLAQENPQTTAVSGFKSRNAFSTDAAMVVVEGTKTIGKVVKAAATFMSACSATGNVAPDVTIPGSCAQVSIFSGAPVSSAAQAAKQFATTMNLAASAAPTAQSGGAPIRATSSIANTTTTQTVPSPMSSSTASEAGEQTVTATTTVDHTITATVTALPTASEAATSDAVLSDPPTSIGASSAAASSAPVPSASSAMMPSYTNSTSIVYSMISTVYGPPSASSSIAVPTSLAASSTQPPADAPTVAADGMVQRRQASEHMARRSSRRGHARWFK